MSWRVSGCGSPIVGCFNVGDGDLPNPDLGAVKVSREAVHSLAGMSIGLVEGVSLPQC